MSRHPDITRTSVHRPCAACDGDGEVVVNDSPQPFGLRDPQCDVDVECSVCHGTGEIVEWVDPLLSLRRARIHRRIWPWRYGEVRQRVVSPVHLPDMPVAFRMEHAA